MIKRRATIQFILIFLGATAHAQSKPANTRTLYSDTVASKKGNGPPTDGYLKKNNSFKPTELKPLPNVREADVLFAKRIWREIDTREKMNRYISSPKQRLIDILMAAIAAGEIIAYDASGSAEDINGDSFSKPLSATQAGNKLADSSIVDIINKKTGDKVRSKMVAGEFNPDSVVKFRVKEDWVFEKQRSVYVLRIIGIAPMVKISAGGLATEYQPAFWVNFEQAKKVLANKEVLDANSDATGLSYADVFFKRLFMSYIVKQSNDRDERIRDYARGIDKIFESDRLKKRLMDWEINLWQY